MPAILDFEQAEEWLNPDSDPEQLKQLLLPYPNELVDSWRVSKLVNYNRNEGPELIQPA
jgi:putative SOS response-associated peptidase YedK